MSNVIRQIRIAAQALHYESDTCEHCRGTGRLRGSLRPCICTGGKLYYPQRVETGSNERAFGFGKTDEQIIDLWAQRPYKKKEE